MPDHQPARRRYSRRRMLVVASALAIAGVPLAIVGSGATALAKAKPKPVKYAPLTTVTSLQSQVKTLTRQLASATALIHSLDASWGR